MVFLHFDNKKKEGQLMNNLRKLRKEKKLTLRELSEQVQINYANLSKMENGKRNLNNKAIFSLCDFFEVTSDYLLGLSPHRNFNTIHSEFENEKEYNSTETVKWNQNRLKEIRKENNLTQKQLAEKLNCKETTISMWESGQNEMNYETINTLTKMFNVTSDYLLGLSPYRNFMILEIDNKDVPTDPNEPARIIYPENVDQNSEESKTLLDLAEKIFSLPPEKISLIEQLVDQFNNIPTKTKKG